MEAISHAGTVLGVLAKDGIVLAAEKKVTGKLLDLSETKSGGYGGSGEKIFLLNSCARRSLLAASDTHRFVNIVTWSRGSQGSPQTQTLSSTMRANTRSDICINTTKISPLRCSHRICVT